MNNESQFTIVDLTDDSEQLQGLIENVLNHFSEWIGKVQSQGIVFGFDGFIDELMTVIRKRYTIDSYETMETMTELADRISATAGSGANCETILKDRRPGGFVPNTSQGLATVAFPIQNITLIGNFGFPNIQNTFHNIFEQDLHCHLISIGDPGTTSGYEFNDGKVMLTNFMPVHANSPETINQAISLEDLISLIQNTTLLGLGYWSINAHMNEIFQMLRDQIFSQLDHPLEVFLDLADLKKKSYEDILYAIDLIKSFPESVIITISLNDKEAIELFQALNQSSEAENVLDAKSKEDFIEILKFISDSLPFRRIAIHHPRFALIAMKNTDSNECKISIVPNCFTEHPKFTVAAGDTFNSGLCFGILAQCQLDELILIGNTLTSYFIRTGTKGNAEQITTFLSNYNQYLIEDYSEII